MESPLTKLPVELQKTLQSWYRTSAILFAGTLLSMAALQIGVTLYLYRVSERLAQPSTHAQESSTNAEDAVIQKKLDALDAFAEQHGMVLALLAKTIEKMPHDMGLSQCTITAQKTCACSGQARDIDSVTEFVAALQSAGLTCTTVSTNHDPEKEYALQFHIKAQQCLKS